MYLKKLTLNGFKSFADKTELDILPGVTSIVGPNGCGKSNIVDAISWVLGEQRIRVLRGHKMEDVIFKGSRSRPPVGMAEVSLTFDNSDGRLPLEFSEVTITRRVFRSGESNYLINKKICRLRDIDELILGTGLGNRTYAVVEQGRIDQILQSRPEERRALLEEAAGISKYRKKKEEALRKLEYTRNNLLRVEDIVKEVTRQLNLTHRQARQAERYRRYQEKLRGLEITLGRFQFKDLERQGRELSESEAALKKECRAQEDRIQAAEDELAVRRRERREGEEKLNEIRGHLLDQQAEIEKARQLADLNRERIGDLKSRREHLQREIERLRTLREKNRSDREALRGEVAKFKEVNKEKSAVLAEKEKDLSREQRGLASLRRELMEVRTRSFEFTREEGLARNEYLSLQAGSKERILRRRKLEVELEKLTAEEEELRAGIDRAEKLHQEMLREVEIRRAALKDAGGKADSLEDEMRSLAGEKERISLELKENEAWLQAREAEAGSGISSLDLIMEESSRPESKLGGVIGPLRDLIEPEPGFEKAVQAALGEKEDAVVVRESADALNCIEYLKKQGAGRAVFIVAASLAREPSASAMPPVRGETLADHLRLRAPLEGRERILFGDSILVEDISSRVIPSPGREHVTPGGGRMVFPGFIFWRGEDSTRPNLSPRELTRRIALSRKQLEEVAARLARQAALVGEGRSAYENQKELLHQEETRIAVSESELERRSKSLEKIGLNRVGLREEISSLKEEESRNSGRRKELALRLKEGSGEEGELQEKTRDLQRLVMEMESEVRTREAGVTDLKISLASSREREDLLQGQLSGLEDQGEELEKSRGERIAQIGRDEERREELERAIGELEASREAGEKQLEKLRAELGSVEEETGRLVRECEEKENAYRTIRPGFQEAQSRLNSRQVKLAEVRWQKENLERTIREKYRVELREVPDSGEKIDPEIYTRDMEEVKLRLEKMPNVNLAALEEQESYEARLRLLTEQQADLEGSTRNLEAAIKKINITAGDKLRRTYEVVREEFRRLFSELFQGGEADLVLTDEKDILESGLEIVAQPPGKKQAHISLLSGGEKAMTSIALIFSLFKVQPSPFYLLDEIDAPLDEANIGRFITLLRELVKSAQFVVITHNKRTIREADILYGITMQESGVSKIISMKLGETASSPASN